MLPAQVTVPKLSQWNSVSTEAYSEHRCVKGFGRVPQDLPIAILPQPFRSGLDRTQTPLRSWGTSQGFWAGIGRKLTAQGPGRGRGELKGYIPVKQPDGPHGESWAAGEKQLEAKSQFPPLSEEMELFSQNTAIRDSLYPLPCLWLQLKETVDSRQILKTSGACKSLDSPLAHPSCYRLQGSMTQAEGGSSALTLAPGRRKETGQEKATFLGWSHWLLWRGPWGTQALVRRRGD